MSVHRTVKRRAFQVTVWAVTTCRWVAAAGRPSIRAMAVAMLLGVVLSSLLSPDLQAVGAPDALAAGTVADRGRSVGSLDSYASPSMCDKDQYFQEAFSWQDFLSYFTGAQTLYKSTSTVGYCLEKPRTTRPGVQGGNRWDYWDDYWERERHKNDSFWGGDWWGR